MSANEGKVRCPYCPAMMASSSTACRKCWRRGKGRHRKPRWHGLEEIINRVKAMNLRPGESVNIGGLTFTKEAPNGE